MELVKLNIKNITLVASITVQGFDSTMWYGGYGTVGTIPYNFLCWG